MTKFSTVNLHLIHILGENSVYFKCQNKHRFVLFNDDNIDSS